MLIYKNDGSLYCISEKALKLAGYESVVEFLDEHDDFSELFVKKPGYIYNFENFSWLSFLRNANPEQKRVLIATRDKATYECDLEMEIVFPVTMSEETPEFFYQINFRNLHLSDGTRRDAFSADTFELSLEEAGAPMETTPASTYPIEETPQTEESSPTFEITPEESDAPLFGTPSPKETPPPASEPKEEEAPVLFLSETEPQNEPQTPPPTPDEPLEMIDFELQEESPSPLHEEPSAETAAPAEAPQASPLEEEERIELLFEPRSEEVPEASAQEESTESTEGSVEENVEEAAQERMPETAQAKTGDLPATEEPASQPSTEESPAPAVTMPDIKKSAATLGLSESTVKAFIQEFVHTYFDEVHEIKAALESGHLPVVKREVMKLKGIAANLLMEDLAKELEAILPMERASDIKEAWQGVDLYMRGLTAIFPAQSAPPASEPSSPETPAAQKSLPPFLAAQDVGTEQIAFDPATAAEALGLPESLILEFVHDFIRQADEERESFRQAFEAGDIKRVNEVAHKLKGVAANLRIEEMKELMEKAQHASTLEEAEPALGSFYKKLAQLENTMAKEFT